MGFHPRFLISPTILGNLVRVAEAKGYIDSTGPFPAWERTLRRQALVRTVHFSTAIEGNPLDLDEVSAILDGAGIIQARPRDRLEITNYREVIESLEAPHRTTVALVHEINRILMKGIDDVHGGKPRSVQNYVVKVHPGGEKEVVFTPPGPADVAPMMEDLVAWMHDAIRDGTHPAIVAGIAHHQLVTIHPYVDGNGRTARVLATDVLHQNSHDIRRLFSLEEYYDQDLSTYYNEIQAARDKDDMTGWLEYFTGGLASELERVKMQVARRPDTETGDAFTILNDRQKDVMQYLESHGKITNREYRERYNVSNFTAYSDFQSLLQRDIVRKRGKGRATMYVLNRGDHA